MWGWRDQGVVAPEGLTAIPSGAFAWAPPRQVRRERRADRARRTRPVGELGSEPEPTGSSPRWGGSAPDTNPPGLVQEMPSEAGTCGAVRCPGRDA